MWVSLITRKYSILVSGNISGHEPKSKNPRCFGYVWLLLVGCLHNQFPQKNLKEKLPYDNSFHSIYDSRRYTLIEDSTAEIAWTILKYTIEL